MFINIKISKRKNITLVEKANEILNKMKIETV
jgi:hypothetical protein